MLRRVIGVCVTVALVSAVAMLLIANPTSAASTRKGRTSCSSATLARSASIAPSYDYIILGAGAAGSIVANKLAKAMPQNTFLLVEAGVRTGNNDNVNVSNPAFWLNVVHNETVEWGFQTAPQTGMNNRSLSLGFAKATGGSAMHNAMGYVRGGQRWMDAWDANGATGWASYSMIPYFSAVEAVMNMVAPANDTQGLVDAIFQASNQAGFPYNPSYNNGPDMFGIANFVMSVNDISKEKSHSKKHKSQKGAPDQYRRVTSWQKYLDEPGLPSNVQLVTGYLADQLFMDDYLNVNAMHLWDEVNECDQFVGVRREVISCLGTVQSPALLLRSGIGPTLTVQAAGVTPLLDLPGVGQNFRDDIVVNLVYTTEAKDIESPPASFLSAVLFAVDNSTVDENGEWQVNFIPGSSSSDESGELQGTGALTNIELLFSTGNMISNSWPEAWQNSLVLSPNVQQCKARGVVTIADDLPTTKPIIDPNYLNGAGDVDRVVNSILLSRQVLAQPAFAQWQFTEVQPGPQYSTRQQLSAWVVQNAGTGYHYIGTCAMGTDVNAVVDPTTMRVYNVTGLRIVDASVVPSSLSANTQSVTMAVAARGADLIIKDYKEREAKAAALKQQSETENSPSSNIDGAPAGYVVSAEWEGVNNGPWNLVMTRRESQWQRGAPFAVADLMSNPTNPLNTLHAYDAASRQYFVNVMQNQNFPPNTLYTIAIQPDVGLSNITHQVTFDPDDGYGYVGLIALSLPQQFALLGVNTNGTVAMIDPTSGDAQIWALTCDPNSRIIRTTAYDPVKFQMFLFASNNSGPPMDYSVYQIDGISRLQNQVTLQSTASWNWEENGIFDSLWIPSLKLLAVFTWPFGTSSLVGGGIVFLDPVTGIPEPAVADISQFNGLGGNPLSFEVYSMFGSRPGSATYDADRNVVYFVCMESNIRVMALCEFSVPATVGAVEVSVTVEPSGYGLTSLSYVQVQQKQTDALNEDEAVLESIADE